MQIKQKNTFILTTKSRNDGTWQETRRKSKFTLDKLSKSISKKRSIPTFPTSPDCCSPKIAPKPLIPMSFSASWKPWPSSRHSSIAASLSYGRSPRRMLVLGNCLTTNFIYFKWKNQFKTRNNTEEVLNTISYVTFICHIWWIKYCFVQFVFTNKR